MKRTAIPAANKATDYGLWTVGLIDAFLRAHGLIWIPGSTKKERSDKDSDEVVVRMPWGHDDVTRARILNLALEAQRWDNSINDRWTRPTEVYLSEEHVEVVFYTRVLTGD